MQQLTLAPIKQVNGEVTVPGSKSLSNRALLLAGLAVGNTEITNLPDSDDTWQMINALRQLGVGIERNGTTAQVTGHGGLFESPGDGKFSLGNAGTAVRPLTAILSLIPGEFHVDGDDYMRERPISHLVDALRQLGAEITYEGESGCPPIRLTGGQVNGGKLSIPGNISSQYLTALLMALPLCRADSDIAVVGEQVSKPYLDITLNIMRRFNVLAVNVPATDDNEASGDYRQFHIPGNQQYRSPGSLLVEGDASSASYFFGAAAIRGKVRVHGIGELSIQGDYRFLDVIEEMGASVHRTADWVEVTGSNLHGIDVDLNHIPDAAMTVAAMALFARGKTVIRNIYNWRVKETDRMHAMSTGLRQLGATVVTGDDYIVIEPPAALKAATIETHGDHRVAMSFSLAALGNQAITIKDPDCTRKTFPGYFSTLSSISVLA